MSGNFNQNSIWKKYQKVQSSLCNQVYILNVRSTLNNIYVSITNIYGKVFFVSSGGRLKSSSKKNTNYNLELLLGNILKELKNLGVWNLFVRIDFASLKRRKTIIKVIQRLSFHVLGIQLMLTKAFNGVRLSKKRRI